MRQRLRFAVPMLAAVIVMTAWPRHAEAPVAATPASPVSTIESLDGLLQQAVSQPDPQQRSDASTRLARRLQASDLPWLVGERAVAGPRARAALDQAFAGLCVQRSLPALVALLDHGDAAVRRAAAVALGLVGDPTALDPLLTAFAQHEHGPDLLRGLEPARLWRRPAPLDAGGWLAAIARLGRAQRSLPLLVGILSNQVDVRGGRCEAGVLHLIADGTHGGGGWELREGEADWSVSEPGLRERAQGLDPAQTTWVSLPHLSPQRVTLDDDQERRLCAVVLATAQRIDDEALSTGPGMIVACN